MGINSQEKTSEEKIKEQLYSFYYELVSEIENKIIECRKSHTYLEKCKFVLSYKIQELKKEAGPMEKVLEDLQKRTKEDEEIDNEIKGRFKNQEKEYKSLLTVIGFVLLVNHFLILYLPLISPAGGIGSETYIPSVRYQGNSPGKLTDFHS